MQFSGQAIRFSGVINIWGDNGENIIREAAKMWDQSVPREVWQATRNGRPITYLFSEDAVAMPEADKKALMQDENARKLDILG